MKIESHLKKIYQRHGDKLFRWDRPIRYIVVGLQQKEPKQVVERQFAYIRDLTGLDIQQADPVQANGNFILVFANPIAQIAEFDSYRAVFGRQKQTVDDYRKMLEQLDRDGAQRKIFKRTADSIGFFAVLTNPTLWEGELIDTHFLKLIVEGLTETRPSNEIRPSIWNTTDVMQPAMQLPSVDEAYLKALYRGSPKSGLPLDAAVHELASAISAELTD